MNFVKFYTNFPERKRERERERVREIVRKKKREKEIKRGREKIYCSYVDPKC